MDTPQGDSNVQSEKALQSAPGMLRAIIAILAFSIVTTLFMWMEDNLLEGYDDRLTSLDEFLVVIIGSWLYIGVIVVPVNYLAWNLLIAPTVGLKRLSFRESIVLSAGLILISGLL